MQHLCHLVSCKVTLEVIIDVIYEKILAQIIKLRTNLKIFFKIKLRMHVVYRDCAPSLTTIRYRFNEFKQRRTTIFDEDHSDCPKSHQTTQDMVNKF